MTMLQPQLRMLCWAQLRPLWYMNFSSFLNACIRTIAKTALITWNRKICIFSVSSKKLKHLKVSYVQHRQRHGHGSGPNRFVLKIPGHLIDTSIGECMSRHRVPTLQRQWLTKDEIIVGTICATAADLSTCCCVIIVNRDGCSRVRRASWGVEKSIMRGARVQDRRHDDTHTATRKQIIEDESGWSWCWGGDNNTSLIASQQHVVEWEDEWTECCDFDTRWQKIHSERVSFSCVQLLTTPISTSFYFSELFSADKVSLRHHFIAGCCCHSPFFPSDSYHKQSISGSIITTSPDPRLITWHFISLPLDFHPRTYTYSSLLVRAGALSN